MNQLHGCQLINITLFIITLWGLLFISCQSTTIEKKFYLCPGNLEANFKNMGNQQEIVF